MLNSILSWGAGKSAGRAARDMSGTICVIGMSHTLALLAARKRRNDDDGFHIVNRNRTPEVFPKGRAATDFDPARLGITSPRLLALSVGGNQYNTLTLVRHPQPFTLWQPDTAAGGDGDTGTDAAGTLIPQALMRRLLAARSRDYFAFARKLRDYFQDAPCVLICPPPPIADADHIRAHPNAFADSIHLGIAPAGLRKAAYDLQVGLYRELAAEIAVELLPPPPAALTPAGFLDLHYAQKDPTHGNVRYGALVLDQLTAHATKETPDA